MGMFDTILRPVIDARYDEHGRLVDKDAGP